MGTGRLVDAGDLVGVAEIAELLGVSLARVYQASAMADFPKPVATVGKVCRIWVWPEVAAWRAATERTPAECGTTAKYQRGCRCAECRAANAARMREYNARRRGVA